MIAELHEMPMLVVNAIPPVAAAILPRALASRGAALALVLALAASGCGGSGACEPSPWFADLDQDGFGDPMAATQSCEPPPGHVTDATDCDDADAARHPEVDEACNRVDDDCDGLVDEDLSEPWYLDADGDGFGQGDPVEDCLAPLGSAPQAGDCDDTDPDTFPDAVEKCDRVDNDCDGEVDDDAVAADDAWVDGDGDGFGSTPVSDCASAPGLSDRPGDCDDDEREVHPDALEICNGVDDDCDGGTDVDAADASVWYDDLDHDGFGAIDSGVRSCTPTGVRVGEDCDDTRPEAFPNAPELCNGLDDDCSGAADEDAVDRSTFYADADGDGHGAGPGFLACTPPPLSSGIGDDCDDRNPEAFPGAPERPTDAVDQSCDGMELCLLDADLDDAGGEHFVLSTSITCALANLSNIGGDCDDNDPEQGPLNEEVPYDGLDNDCDPATPDDDLDGDGFLGVDDCDDLNPEVVPGNLLEPYFVDVTESAGLLITHWDGVEQCDTRSDHFSGGAAVGDIDGDGWEDIYLTRQEKPDALFLNRGDGTFVEIGRDAGVDFVGSTNGGLMVDLDGDGDLDIFATSIGIERHRAYLNDGTGRFTEEAVARGLDVPPGAQCTQAFSASAADIDNDGDLDIHTTAWARNGAFNDRSRLLANDGHGLFTDVTEAAGLDLGLLATFATGFGDLDGDGWVDMALCSDWEDTTVWRNVRDGTFEDITSAALGEDLAHNGMGQDLADIDNDGDLDWFVSAVYHPWYNPDIDGNRLFMNDGAARFEDEAEARGVIDGGWAWGSAFFDFDNDSDLDLMITNGFAGNALHVIERNRFFVNDGTAHFEDQACERDLGSLAYGRSVVPFDMDHDGDLDLLVVNNKVPPMLMRNESGEPRSWLDVQLTDDWPNPFGVGAILTAQAEPGGPVLRRDISASSTFGATGPPIAHFGFGAHEGPIHELRIRWPDFTVQVLNDVPVGRRLTVPKP